MIEMMIEGPRDHHCYRTTLKTCTSDCLSQLGKLLPPLIPCFIFHTVTRMILLKIVKLCQFSAHTPPLTSLLAQSEVPGLFCGLWPYLHLLPLHWPPWIPSVCSCLRAFALAIPCLCPCSTHVLMAHFLTVFRPLLRYHLCKQCHVK